MEINKTAVFDKDGYPTEETLLLIQKWPYNDFTGLIEFIEDAWKYSDRVRRLDKYLGYKNVLYLSTGGWSGNESIICALHNNMMFWSCCWICSQRGGHYWFEVK